MFEDLINKDTEGEKKYVASDKDLIKALKDNIKQKEEFIGDLFQQMDEKDVKIKQLEHDIEYLKNL